MIIGRAPNRLTLFGSSTDYPEWYREYGGISINFAINKYSYILIKSLPAIHNYQSRFQYSQTEEVTEHSNIKHRVIKQCLDLKNINEGIDLVHVSDIPTKNGLGSSSTFTVCLLNVLNVWHGKFVDKLTLAKEAIHVDRDLLNESVGNQDFLAAAFGGLTKYEYFPNDDIRITNLYPRSSFIKYWEDSMLAFLVGEQRTASDIASQYIKKLTEKDKVLAQLRFMEIAREGQQAIYQEDIGYIAELLNETWKIKRELSPVITNSTVDEARDAIMGAGGLACKLCGAGQGGCLLVICPPNKKERIRETLKGLKEIPFKIDWEGAKILWMDRSNGV